MKRTAIALFLLTIGLFVAISSAKSASENIGGDVYIGGANPSLVTTAPRDVFSAGFSVSIEGETAGDVHLVGFDLEADGPIGGDLYAVGSNVSVDGPVRGDLTISGFSVRLKRNAAVSGNARIGGGSVKIDAPIAGSLVVAGGSVELNAQVEGDVRLSAASLTFGEAARIGGSLVYSAPQEVAIPASVIPPERVRFHKLDRPGAFGEMRDTFEKSWTGFWPSFFTIFGAFVVTLAFLLVLAAVFIAFAPNLTEGLRRRASEQPGLSMLSGFFGLALILGLVPVSAMTLIGIPLVPIVLFGIVALWVLGYLLGAYWLSLSVWRAFAGEATSNGIKLLVLAVALVVLAILNFIPFLGWLINLAVVLSGLGAIALSIMMRLCMSVDSRQAEIMANGGDN